MKGKTGGFKERRRKASKTLSDMRFVMNYIIAMVKEVGAMEDVITPESVDRMFGSISHKLSVLAKDDRNKWISLARKLRRKQNNLPESEIDAQKES